MNRANELPKFRIRACPSEIPDYFEVCLFADETDLVEQFESGYMGLDPYDLLIEPCALRAGNSPHVALIGRCGCGIIGCGSIEVTIQKVGERVIWTSADSSRSVQFEASQYHAEVERALNDHTWETADRTAGRLILQSIDRKLLLRQGLEFSWISGTSDEGMMTVLLELTPGPYDVLVRVPWDGQGVEWIVNRFKNIFREPAETWPHVEWRPQKNGLGPPPITGPGWK